MGWRSTPPPLPTPTPYRGAFIWQATKQGAWSTHLEGWSRCSASWQLYGHYESCLMVLRDAWRKYAASLGQDASDICDVEGLF